MFHFELASAMGTLKAKLEAEKQTIYIAGPMRGYKEFNFPAFDAACAHLQQNGWNVINPAELDRASGDVITCDEDLTPEMVRKIMHRDCNAIIDKCSALCVLEGWEQSIGANAEVALAHWKDIPVYRFPHMSIVRPKHTAPSTEDPGCWATYTGEGGYDFQKDAASKFFDVGRKYRIVDGFEAAYSTSLVFEGIAGHWNSCLFSFDRERAPITRIHAPPNYNIT